MVQFHIREVRVQPFDSPHMALAHFEKKEVATVLTDLKMNRLNRTFLPSEG